jgi:hypothetical protein
MKTKYNKHIKIGHAFLVFNRLKRHPKFILFLKRLITKEGFLIM